MAILAGDVGGTKVRLALFQENKLIAEKKYPSKEYRNLSEILHLFLSSHAAKIDKACIGIAGPVQDGVCRTTNLPWEVDAKVLAKDLKISKVFLINDLEAHAYGICQLNSADFFLLNEGDLKAKGNEALIAAGTGLGEAGLFWDGKQHHCFASEGGHVDFAPRDEIDISLFKYLHKKYPHVSYERVLSGPGFLELYHFLIDSGLEKKPNWVADEKDLAKVITEKALKKECELSVRVVEWFSSIYGSEAGNLALKFLSLGGLYIGGGIAPKMIPIFKQGGFMKAFKNKGRFSELLSKIPVKIILNEDTALLGAAEYCRRK